MKAIINNQIVDVNVLKERKLFWLFKQVLVEYYDRYNEHEDPKYWRSSARIFRSLFPYKKWIPKSNLK